MSLKKGLGKGMRALVDENELESSGYAENLIDINNIIPNRFQPRKSFHDDTLRELAASIKEKGVIQPVIVSELGDGRYELVAGERRLRAAKIAGLHNIPAIIKDYSEEDRLEIALIENIQREDLNPVEIALAYKEIMERLDLKQEELAQTVGKSRTTVANTLRLLKLPSYIRDLVVDGELTEGHARAILSITDVDKMIDFAKYIVGNGLSVREAENLAKEFGGNGKEDKKSSKPKEKKQTEMGELAERFIQSLGAKVKISGSQKTGKIEIFYYSQEELENIYNLISRKMDISQ
jgi:ParB family chromosome partitioning protein